MHCVHIVICVQNPCGHRCLKMQDGAQKHFQARRLCRVGAACDGWLLGRGRFPPIGGRPGNTAATTLAADSRLTSFSQEQSSLPFQTQNNLNQDGRGSGG